MSTEIEITYFGDSKPFIVDIEMATEVRVQAGSVHIRRDGDAVVIEPALRADALNAYINQLDVEYTGDSE